MIQFDYFVQYFSNGLKTHELEDEWIILRKSKFFKGPEEE